MSVRNPTLEQLLARRALLEDRRKRLDLEILNVDRQIELAKEVVERQIDRTRDAEPRASASPAFAAR